MHGKSTLIVWPKIRKTLFQLEIPLIVVNAKDFNSSSILPKYLDINFHWMRLKFVQKFKEFLILRITIYINVPSLFMKCENSYKG